MEDLQTRIAQATANRDKLAAELQRVSTLHIKWQGVVEYLTSLKAQAEQGERQEAEPVPFATERSADE